VRAFRVTVTADHEDAATALLWDAGTSGIEVKPCADGRLDLLAYFPEGTDDGLVSRSVAGLPGASVRPVPVPDVDWVARFRESFSRFSAGRFQVVPVWEDAPPDRFSLRMDPGRAFGTGTHETTRLCLAALEALAREAPLGRVADVGTGTGILAVAALRLGARWAVGVDDDPEAVREARRHAELNGETVHLVRGDGGAALAPASFDAVVANVTGPVLIAHAAELQALVRPGGALVLSGLLEEDLGQVAAAYAAIGRAAVTRDGEWAALVFRKAP
jgi:ribosomal protein L11 methyltransferase